MTNMLLSDKYLVEIIFNIIILFIVILGTAIFLSKINFESKSYKILFINYIFFWFSIMVVREFRHIHQHTWDKNLDWLPLMIYGAVGIVIRPLFDILGSFLKNRKWIIYIAILLQLITFSCFIIEQNVITSVIQSIGIGIGASLIGTYELLFKEQYGKSKSYLTVSILAFPPIIADFLSSPIQAIVNCYAEMNNGEFYLDRMMILWFVSISFIPISFLTTYFVKEDRNLVAIKQNDNIVFKHKKDYLLFLMVLLMGIIITFIKFANSGGVAQNMLRTLNDISDNKITPSMYGYLSLVFTLGQIIGTFLFSFLILKNKSKNLIFLIGIISWIIYHFVSIFIFDPYFFLSVHLLNGFSYGILYNLILAYVLTLSFNTNKITPMGIYQSVSAIGIASSTFFSSYIKQNIKIIDIKTAIIILDSIILFFIFLLISIYYLNEYLISKKNQKMINI